MHHRIATLRTDRRHIPDMIKRMSLMMFLLVLGWGMGGDVFFSVYVESIVDSALVVSIVGAILAIVKMTFSLAMGDMSGKGNLAKIIRGGKRIYAACGIFFVMAGLFNSSVLLIIAIVSNGIGSAMLFTAYQYYFREHSNRHNRYAVLGLMYSAINGAYVIGALVAALVVMILPLWAMYIFVTVFALFSLWGRKRLEIDVNPLAKSMTKRLGLWRQMFYELVSGKTYHHSLSLFRTYGLSFASRLGLVSLLNASNYMGFLFVPLLAVTYNFSLSAIAVLFAVMRLPAMLSYFIGDWEDKIPYQRILLFGLGGLTLCFIGFAFFHHFIILIIIGILMGFLITLLRPIVVGNVLASARERDAGATTGVMTVFARLGEIIGSLFFGILSTFIGINGAFAAFACIIGFVFVIFILTFYKK